MNTRREVLKAAALTGLASACGRGPTLEPLKPGDAPVAYADASPRWERLAKADLPAVESAAFPLGVSSGDVSLAGAVLHCRYTGQAPLKLLVWSPTAILELPVEPGDYGFVHAEVGGLQPDTYYSYAFVEATGERSPIGRFRSAQPELGLRPLVFGATSCTSNHNELSALDHAARRTDLDAFLLLGDTVYADGASTAQQYRDKWHGSLSRPQYRALRAQVPLIATWDDHEVDNDWNPERVSMAKLAAARAAFFEHLPIRRDADEPDRVWRSIRFGHTAEVFVLDGRSERKPSTILTGGTQYLSDRQLAWLKASLAASPCVFKVLMNSVPITQFPFSTFNVDGWNAYVAQRRELLELIDANVRGVLWVSGDHHFACVGRVAPSGPGATQLEALAGPGAQDSAVLWRSCVGPQFDWAAPDNNYLAIHLDPTTREARLVYWSRQGTKLQDQRYVL